MKTYAIVLAAGLGTRMKSELPKCAIPLLEKPMIEYIVDNLEKSYVDEIICVVGYKSDDIEKILGNRVRYIKQEKQIGTANAVLQCLNYLEDGKSIILPGDVPLVDSDIINNIINYNENVTIGTMNLDNPFGYGRIVRSSDNIIKITEEKDSSKKELLIKEVNTGILCLNNNLLKRYIPLIDNNNSKSEYYITDIIGLLSSKYKISSYFIKDSYKVIGVNDLFSLSELECILSKKIKQKHILNGVTLINKDSIVISYDTVIESNVIIYPNVVILGKTLIRKNSVIEPNSLIRNSIIHENVVVNSSVINDSIINKNSTIGPFSNIKLNSEIGENNRIGNYVEIKNSKTSSNTNAAHLSYIGDATIGANVNFGCGSITVNYDGKIKSKTIIKDNVFIGCNSNLIAPIEISSNSFIAAGTTVTNDVASGDLVIGRVKQQNKKGYLIK